MTAPEHTLAEAQLVGALAYGQLRAYAVTADAIRLAPDVDGCDRVASFSAAEHDAYRRLRAHLDDLTELGPALMERQRPAFDVYFAAVPDTWVERMAFFAFTLPIAADFTRAVAVTLEPGSGEVLLRALAQRDEFERYAQDQVRAHLDAVGADGVPDAMDRLRAVVADLLGKAMTSFQTVLADSDALQVLLAAHAERVDPGGRGSERVATQLVVQVLDGHRRRMHAFGLDDLA